MKNSAGITLPVPNSASTKMFHQSHISCCTADEEWCVKIKEGGRTCDRFSVGTSLKWERLHESSIFSLEDCSWLRCKPAQESFWHAPPASTPSTYLLCLHWWSFTNTKLCPYVRRTLTLSGWSPPGYLSMYWHRSVCCKQEKWWEIIRKRQVMQRDATPKRQEQFLWFSVPPPWCKAQKWGIIFAWHPRHQWSCVWQAWGADAAHPVRLRLSVHADVYNLLLPTSPAELLNNSQRRGRLFVFLCALPPFPAFSFPSLSP